MEDPGITRLDIDHYRRSLKRDLDDVTRKQTLALLADAEARLSARRTREKWEEPIASLHLLV
jgi:hypothetical protein